MCRCDPLFAAVCLIWYTKTTPTSLSSHFIQTEVKPDEENVCLHTETYEENTVITIMKPEERKEKSWCFSLSSFFRCEKTVTAWVHEAVPRVFTRKRIVPRCCVGYKEKGQLVTKCVPECLKGCQFGKCVAPEVCACEPGFYGSTCIDACPGGFWGKNCVNKCDCSDNGICHPVWGKCKCEPGWSGDRCESPCQSGYYGESCKHKCNCDGQMCNHKTGKCIPSESVADSTVATPAENSFASQSTSLEISSTEIRPFESEEVPTMATTDVFIPESTKSNEEIEKTNLKDNSQVSAFIKLASNTTGSFVDINTTPTNESKNEGLSNSSDTITGNADYEVTIREEKKTLSESNEESTEESKNKTDTENFLSERHGDSNEEATPVYLRFLPTFSVLAGVSFITVITAAGWVVVKHVKKARIMASAGACKDRTQTEFQLEEKLKHQPDDFLWVCNYSRSSAHLSDGELRNPTPILRTFKPVPENRKFVPKES